MGLHRHPEHRVDFLEWAPGALCCALVGDFNGWSPTENCAREGHLGLDDYGYWFIILEDKLNEGEEPDELYFQQYNYVEDYDKGDNGASIEEIIQKANDEYWEPGEDEYIKNRFQVPAKLYEEWFGPNGPETEEELDKIPLEDAETRYKAWKEQHKDDPPSNLPPLDVIDQGKEYDIFNVVSDPVWYDKILAKKPPIPYWFETGKGKQAWLKKYTPAIPHGSKYRVYFNTPNGPLERVPAWATYVEPGAEGKQPFAIHWEPPPECAHKWKNSRPKMPKSLHIYECLVGISGSEPKMSSLSDFTEKVLPHVKKAGYNAIQLIGVVEHKDYFTVGYRTGFLISGLGLLVFLEIVHSYSATDEMVGLAHFGGSNDCYFHTAKNQNFSNCKKLTTLVAEFAWRINENNQREMSIFFGTRLYDGLGWLAWGVNPAELPQMVGTRAIIGIKHPNGSFGTNTFNITSDTKMGCKLLPENFNEAKNEVGFYNLSMGYKREVDYYVIKGRLILPFAYNISKLNHVWQVGYLGEDGVTPVGHPTILQNVDSSETINLTNGLPVSHVGLHRQRLRTVHGILNIAGWGVFLPSGVIAARYCKYPLEWKWWFKLHVSCQIVGYILGTAGWVVGLCLGSASKFYAFHTHRLYAIFIFTFATLQMLALRLKPERTDEYRKYWNMYHHFLGYSLLAVISINIFNGIDILKPDKTWRWAYIVILVSFAAIVAALEIYTWTRFKKDDHPVNTSTSGAAFPPRKSPPPPNPRP